MARLYTVLHLLNKVVISLIRNSNTSGFLLTQGLRNKTSTKDGNIFALLSDHFIRISDVIHIYCHVMVIALIIETQQDAKNGKCLQVTLLEYRPLCYLVFQFSI